MERLASSESMSRKPALTVVSTYLTAADFCTTDRPLISV
jgi:hypothetical protein